MEPEQSTEVSPTERQLSVWKTVTPFSKYLATILFVALPFVGGYVGYIFAPEKVVEVEKTVEVEVAQEEPEVQNDLTLTSSAGGVYMNDKLGFSVNYSGDWRVDSFEDNSVQFFNYPESQATFASRWPEGANKVEGGGGIVVNLDEVENLSEYSLVTQRGVQFYRLDPNANNDNRWISILVPYPDDGTQALRFAVYGDENTREEMLARFIQGLSFEVFGKQVVNQFTLPLDDSILKAAENVMDTKQQESIELNDDYWGANSAEQPDPEQLSPDGLKVYIPFVCNCGGFSTAGILAQIENGTVEYEVLNGVNVEWQNAVEYRYKKMISDMSVCEGVDGMCIAQRLSDDWYEGTTE